VLASLTTAGKALVVTQLFRLFFGGYLIGKDQYYYNDTESALTVLIIYTLLGVFTALFLFGKNLGLIGIVGLTIILVVLHTMFLVIALGQSDPLIHSPLENLWATLLRYLFSLLTLIFSFKASKQHRAK